MPTSWSSEVNKAILEQVKWRNGIMIICFHFLRDKNYVHKIIPETVHYIGASQQNLFGIICIYLSFVSIIWNHLQKCFLQLEHHTERFICKTINTWGIFI